MAGLILSVIGAGLDFTVGTMILQSPSAPMTPGTGMSSTPVGMNNWTALLYGLGVLLVVSGVLGVTRTGSDRMRIFGGLMIIYGFVMVVVGASMFMGITPMMQNTTIAGTGMLVVGLAMIVNGLFMAIRQQAMR